MRMSKYLCLAGALFLTFGAQAQAKVDNNIPATSDFKSYMSYKSITNQSSKQYQLQQNCETNEDGLRVYGDRYVVAVGTGFAETVGVELDVYLDTGEKLECITGDIKADVHTDVTNRYCTHDGTVLEFIVDTETLQAEAKRSGDISQIPGFEGDITSIDIHDEEVDVTEPAECAFSKPITEWMTAQVTPVLSKFKQPLNLERDLYFVEFYSGDPTFNCLCCTEDEYLETVPGETQVAWVTGTKKAFLVL